jgi:hypothetical protein
MNKFIYFLANSKPSLGVACDDFKDEGYSCVPKNECAISNCGTDELSDEPDIRSGQHFILFKHYFDI